MSYEAFDTEESAQELCPGGRGQAISSISAPDPATIGPTGPTGPLVQRMGIQVRLVKSILLSFQIVAVLAGSDKFEGTEISFYEVVFFSGTGDKTMIAPERVAATLNWST